MVPGTGRISGDGGAQARHQGESSFNAWLLGLCGQDRTGLLEWVNGMTDRPTRIEFVHGDDRAGRGLWEAFSDDVSRIKI